MKKIELLYLSQEDVMQIGMTMGETIRVIQEVLTEHGGGHFENPPKPGIHPQDDAFIHAMPGYLPRKKASGLKWVSGFSSNHKAGLPNIMGLMVLNDVATGQPLAVMDCTWITAVRTGAVSAVAAKFLAVDHPTVVAIVGTGVQGRTNLLALKEVLPDIQVARVYDVIPQAHTDYVQSMGPLCSFPIEVAASSQEAIEGADVIVTATGKLTHSAYRQSWVKEGALVLPVHTRGWDPEVLDSFDRFVVDDWEQFSRAQLSGSGFYESLPEEYTQLGEIVTGQKPGRASDRERIINFNYGMAIHDVAMAQYIYTQAKSRGIGTMLPVARGPLRFFT